MATAVHRGQFGHPDCPTKPGRPKGTPNRATKEIKALTRYVFEDTDYLDHFVARLIAGTIPPQVEAQFWQYRFGLPRKMDNASPMTEGLYGKSPAELAARAETVRARLAVLAAEEAQRAQDEAEDTEAEITRAASALDVVFPTKNEEAM
jgi:hypothetical protein